MTDWSGVTPVPARVHGTRAEQAARRADAVELAEQGVSATEIARRLGYRNPLSLRAVFLRAERRDLWRRAQAADPDLPRRRRPPGARRRVS